MADTTYQIYSRFIDPVWIQPLRPSLHGREIAYPNPFVVGDGISNINTQKIKEMGPPIVQFAGNDFNGQSQDSIGYDPVVVKPVEIIEPFKIPRDLFNSFINGNNIQMSQSINLASNFAYSASYKVAQMENSIIFNGWAPDGAGNIEVDGFLSGAGTIDTTTAYLFGKFNGASECAGDLISAVNDAGADPSAFNFSMSPNLYNTVNRVTSTAGVREMDNLLKVLNNPISGKDGSATGPGKVIKDFTLPYDSATGIGSVLLSPVDPTRTWIELYITVDYRSVLSPAATLPELRPLEGAVYCSMAPHIKQAGALAAATNVSKAAA